MVLYPTRTIKNHVYTSTISVIDFGNASISEADEKLLLAELPQTLKYSDINFVANMVVDENHLPAFAADDAEEGTYDVVRLNLNNKEILIDENFTVSYSIDANTLRSYTSTKNSIQDIDCLARCMIYLWEQKVIEQVTTLLETARVHTDNFTTASTEVVI